jgi:hypothetical protein
MEQSYTELCELGRALRQSKDDAQWGLGDLALLVETRYGERTIADFAREVGVSKSSLYRYRNVAAFYALPGREELLTRWPSSVITYSHYCEAMKLEDMAAAVDVLEFAALGGEAFSSGEARQSGSPFSVDELAYEVSLRMRDNNGGAEKPTKALIYDNLLNGGAAAGLLAKLDLRFSTAHTYRIQVYEIEDDDQ